MLCVAKLIVKPSFVPPTVKSILAKIKAQDVKVSVNGVQLKPMTPAHFAFQPININVPPPPQVMYAYPLLGSIWEVEDLSAGSQLWVTRGPTVQYEVVGVDKVMHLVNVMHTTFQSKCWVNIVAWNSTGEALGSFGSYRFVPPAYQLAAAPVGVGPVVGSIWNSETQDPTTGVWSKSNGPYQIVSVVGNQVEFEPAGVKYPTLFKYHIAHWGPNGAIKRGGLTSGTYPVRFVPAGP